MGENYVFLCNFTTLQKNNPMQIPVWFFGFILTLLLSCNGTKSDSITQNTSVSSCRSQNEWDLLCRVEGFALSIVERQAPAGPSEVHRFASRDPDTQVGEARNCSVLNRIVGELLAPSPPPHTRCALPSSRVCGGRVSWWVRWDARPSPHISGRHGHWPVKQEHLAARC